MSTTDWVLLVERFSKALLFGCGRVRSAYKVNLFDFCFSTTLMSLCAHDSMQSYASKKIQKSSQKCAQMTSLFYVLNFNGIGAAEGQCSLLRNNFTDPPGMQKVRLTVGAGFWLVNSVTMMMPAENISIFSSYCVSALRVSGAIYIGVPGHRDIISNTSPWNARAKPTSAIFAAPAVIRIFAGFRSRWISLSQWRYRRPADMSIRYDRVWRKLSGGVALILDARLSSISSVNRHGHLFGACPTPIKETTEGWLRWRRRRHSSPNRSINACRPGFPGEINIGWSTFAATFCPSYKVR